MQWPRPFLADNQIIRIAETMEGMTHHLQWSLFLVLALMLFGRKWVPWLGHLPGDFTLHRGNLTLLVPLGTCLLVSIALSILAAVFGKR